MAADLSVFTSKIQTNPTPRGRVVVCLCLFLKDERRKTFVLSFFPPKKRKISVPLWGDLTLMRNVYFTVRISRLLLC